MNKKQWKRICSTCGEEVFHTLKQNRDKFERNGSSCKSCAKLGNKNWLYGRRGKDHPAYGKTSYNIWLEKCGKEEADKRQKEANEKNSKSQPNVSGKNNAMYGRCAYDIWVEKYGKLEADRREKQRILKLSKTNKGKHFSNEVRKNARLRRIEEIEEKCGQIMPNYNKKAISIIRAKAKELGITDLQHAENGGEHQVCGYFVDGHSKEKNIVIEYYEPFHKNQIERDKRRKQEIIKELGCEFIEIKEK